MNPDPLTLASTFATLVQLIGMFKQERSEAVNLDHQQFVEWLSYHRHEEIKNLICNTAALQSEVANLLRQDTGAILKKLDSMNAILVKMLSQIDGFSGISRVLVPNSELSEQAISLLRQLLNSGSRNLIYGEISGAVILQPDNGEPLTYTDVVFLADDIDALAQCGFLTHRGGLDPMKMFGITRAGAAFIRALDDAK